MSRIIYRIYRNYQKNEENEESGIKILGIEFYCLIGRGCLIFSQEEIKLKCSPVWQDKHFSLMASCDVYHNHENILLAFQAAVRF